MKLLIIDRKIRKFVKNETLSIVIEKLKKENVEIKWLLVNPEIKALAGEKKNKIDYNDLEDYKTSNVMNVLKNEKPNSILILNDYDFIIRSFIPVAKKLKIPTVLFVISIIDYETEKMNPYLIKNRIADIIIRKKQLLKNFFFMIKNFRIAGYSYKKLLKMIFFEVITPFKYYMPWGNYGCDVILVAGKAWANKLQNLGVKSKVVITGHPRMDLIFEKVSNYKNSTRNDDKINIVLMTTPLVEHGLIERNKWESIIKDVIQTCSKINNVKLVIKIHPTSERIEKYEEIVKKLKINLPIFQREDLAEIVASSDIVVTYGVSSGTLYSIFLKKPVIVYNPYHMSLEEMPYVKEGLATEVNDIKQLTKMIHKIKPVESRKVEEFISKYLYKFDGKSGHRVSKAILELMKPEV